MRKVLILDESGTIDSDYKKEKYFVLGGILYNYDDLETIKDKLIPTFERFRKTLGVKELKSTQFASSKNHKNLIYGALLGLINSVEEIKPIIYVLDKSASYMIQSYNKKSFKYNKLIEFAIKDLLSDGIIDSTDNVTIVIDKISLNDKEMSNITRWLPSNLKQIWEVIMASSEEFNFIQAADLIAGIPKLKGTTARQIKSDPKFTILSNCYIRMFPRNKAHQILSDD